MLVVYQLGLGLLMLSYLALAGFSFWTMFQIGDLRRQDQASWPIKILYWHGVGVMVMLMGLVACAGAITVLRFAWRAVL